MVISNFLQSAAVPCEFLLSLGSASWTGCEAAAHGRSATFIEAVFKGHGGLHEAPVWAIMQAALQQQAQEKKKKPPAVPRAAGGEKWWDSTLLEWPENDFRWASVRHARLWTLLYLSSFTALSICRHVPAEAHELTPLQHLEAADSMTCSHLNTKSRRPVHSFAALM